MHNPFTHHTAPNHYKVPRTRAIGAAPGHRRVPYHSQYKTMSCWYACLKMVLDYHHGPASADSMLKNCQKAQMVRKKNKGLCFTDSIADEIFAELGMKALDWIKYIDVNKTRRLLQMHGPLVMDGYFVRAFKHRSRTLRHAIVVYGISDKYVYYHDPALGTNWNCASQEMPVDTFDNAGAYGMGKIVGLTRESMAARAWR